MCRLPKVIVVAPEDKHAELRRALSSLEYDIAGSFASAEDAAAVSADVALVWEPDEEDLLRLRGQDLKTVAIGATGTSADMELAADDVASFKTRIWELFRPS